MKKIENLTVRRAEELNQESDELEKKVNMANAVINDIEAMMGFKNEMLKLVEKWTRDASFEFHRTGKKPEESHAQFLAKTQGGEIPRVEKDKDRRDCNGDLKDRREHQDRPLHMDFSQRRSRLETERQFSNLPPVKRSVFSGKMGVPQILVAL